MDGNDARDVRKNASVNKIVYYLSRTESVLLQGEYKFTRRAE